MNAPQPETPAAAPEERIGKYRVHPVAALFPPLPDDEYEELKGSIEVMGQAYPIIVQGDVLLDGRNRMRACLELGLPPKIQEYRGTEKPEVFIEFVNLYRRHLGEDARVAISAKIRAWCIAQQNAETQKAQGARGAEGGRGKKKTLEANSSPGFPSEPKTRAKDARSTVGQVADAARVSHHKAAQAVAVAKAAPELLEQVVKGEVKLKDAHAKVKATKSPQPRSSNPKPTMKAQPASTNEEFFDRVACALDLQFAACENPKERRDACVARRVIAVIDELLEFDKVIIKEPVAIVHLKVRRITELLRKGLSAEQRAELRRSEW